MNTSRTNRRRRHGALLAILPGAAAIAGGQLADGTASATTAEEVTISVSNLPPSTEAGAREAFLARVEQFEALHPNIDIEPSEYEWDVATFAAQLAGGTMPTVFQMAFTDTTGVVERGQVSDISAEVAALPYADSFNPNVLRVAQDAEGNTYGIPIAAYGIGLQYNRALFEEAGLEPDAPPTTWEEVRAAAKAISEATGMAGFAQMTQNNTGGWMLTTLSYAFGGRLQELAEDGSVDVTIDNPGTIAALDYLHALRWEDNSMGSNFLFDWGTINQAFAGGQIGMYMGGSDVYNSLVTENQIDPDTYGLTVLPLEGPDAGVLGGGTIAAVVADATDAERAAAVQWIDFYYMAKLTTEEAAVADAEALAANDAPIGTPALPIFSAEQLAESDAWVADFVNVPQAQMAGFRDNIGDQPLIPEPPASTQEMYAILDTVVQTVLTDEGADIAALLADADAEVTALVEAAAG
ncbi:ABC transporter substrate-binding protein [Desertimonas flava]|uniref:ABC transporter substrate-binding protein n=1 Tax=Desertimonas flava TaxID=2064846 RepID=UPI000E350DFC|nr:extracellular solute-binding protein [Desertimonas flava]